MTKSQDSVPIHLTKAWMEERRRRHNYHSRDQRDTPINRSPDPNFVFPIAIACQLPLINGLEIIATESINPPFLFINNIFCVTMQ